MEKFIYSAMTSQYVYTVKKTFHEQSNSKTAEDAFKTILKETQIAISNIETVVKSEEEMRQLLIKLRSHDISFAKDILGLSPKGGSGSYYRAYLAKDEQNIIEVRFSNHYETSGAARDKSNNKSQFLFQVVMITPKTKIQTDSITEPVAMDGNLKILTNASLRFSSSSEEDLKAMLMSIHDYLISPSTTYENAKPITKESNTMKYMKTNKRTITESQLRNIIAESVKKVLQEIGDTPQGQFAINAVRGRAAARPRYQNKQYGGMKAKAQQDAIVNQAGDVAYNARKEADPQYKNRDMDTYANAGYNYGYQKGITN